MKPEKLKKKHPYCLHIMTSEPGVLKAPLAPSISKVTSMFHWNKMVLQERMQLAACKDMLVSQVLLWPSSWKVFYNATQRAETKHSI